MLTVAIASLGVAPVSAHAVEQPAQPKVGPGSSAYPHERVRVTSGGTGADAWFVYEPATPQPASAPLAIVTHGYSEYEGHGMNGAIAEHTARKGNVVIYTRWQTGIATPCPGPIAIEPCIQSEVAGIKGALAYLASHPDHVQPQLERTSYFAFSFGGIVTTNMLARYKELGVPKPRAVFLDDPHDGGLTGNDEPAVAADLTGIPAATKLVCHSGAEGVIGEKPENAGASCNAFFDRLTQIPAANKSITMLSRDDHGQPALSSKHGVCASPWQNESDAQYELAVNAYDWGYCWRAWDALRSCAYTGALCEYALGNTPQNRYVGTWSDGTPLIGLKVQSAGPLVPAAVPARAPAPSGLATVDAPPQAKLTHLKVKTNRRTTVSGRASDDLGVAKVEIAAVRRTGKRCVQLAVGGALTSLRSCTKPTKYLAARGAKAWSLTFARTLTRGSWTFTVRVTDTAGQQVVLRGRTVRIA